ncbi:MAG TPA: hypothetical protein VNO51_04465 [Ilumatobacteraceae bacterium]|nr:hypothetical protein [Ilumatobacteraceae bacterium]
MTNSNDSEAGEPTGEPTADESHSDVRDRDELEGDRQTEDAAASDDPDAPGLSVLGEQAGPPVEPNEPA